MAKKEQVHEDSSSNNNSPEPRTSRSRRIFKASNMSFVEMVEMVDILKRTGSMDLTQTQMSERPRS
ncbi:hypothetical protein AB205_0082120 [Aquarana catesbeiana]|uniref:Uncharacterized protein n=1 Tax=Aquarana catesbeiana TaxID=8400 RepID=A0A2G9PMX1_AQUCT|nr:hypothetical protein AB205_0082120 [Aquarana catesbeiana]